MPQYQAIFELSDLDGENGFRLDGEASGDRAGLSVASAGDFNGDGFADVIVGAPSSDVNGDASGATYVVFGKASGFDAALELSALDSAGGFRIGGVDLYDQIGHVGMAGDINGDGLDDLIIGATGAASGDGAVYVLFGTASAMSAEFDVTTLDGSNGFRIDDAPIGGGFAYAMSTCGDVNGDGFEDVLVTAGFAETGGGHRFGAAYVIFGKASGFASSISVAALDGNNGFKLNCEAGVPYDVHRMGASSAGDVNGDGFGDVFVSARVASDGPSAGYVIFGKAGGFAAESELSALDGNNGFKIGGLEIGSFKAPSVASAGDINGDGYDDIVVGSPYSAPHGNQSGAAYVVFGTASGFDASIDVDALDGANGFKLSGVDVYDRAGCCVASAGDINGDGFGDLMIAAYEASAHGDDSGSVHVVFGRANSFGANFELSSLDGNNGFTVNGEAEDNFMGRSVASAADVNADGFSDIVMGADGANPNGNSSGAAYVFFGGKPAQAVVRIGTAIANTIHGGELDDTLKGLAGNDRLVGHGGADLLTGGAGNDIGFGETGDDQLAGQDGNDKLIGGIGSDMLNGGAGRDELSGAAGADVLNGGKAADQMDGGIGPDTFVYANAKDSSGANCDIITGFDADSSDHFDVTVAVTGIDPAIAMGALSDATFDGDLRTAARHHLDANHAVLFTPDAGDLAGMTFLVVDLNGKSGYQAGRDLVVRLDGAVNLGDIDAADFI
jgi:Ca2+-binding RTX toxin-like protein